MKIREQRIEWEMSYCQHYARGSGPDMVCKAGMDLNAVKRVRVPWGGREVRFGPCIRGHTLPDPKQHCPHWVRRTREQAEAYADEVDRGVERMKKVMPVVSAWRTWSPTNRVTKSEVIVCPACNGRLHLSQSSYNGHVHGRCETDGCVAWME